MGGQDKAPTYWWAYNSTTVEELRRELPASDSENSIFLDTNGYNDELLHTLLLRTRMERLTVLDAHAIDGQSGSHPAVRPPEEHGETDVGGKHRRKNRCSGCCRGFT